MGLKELIIAIFSALAVTEISSWLPYITGKTLRLAVKILPADIRDRHLEEWAADCDTIPGPLSKFFFSLCLIWCACSIKYCFSLGRSLKRSIDIAVSGTALFILSPVILGVAAMLKIEGQGGSLFYGGFRIGQRGQRFRSWKFRSMEPNSHHLLEKTLTEDTAAHEGWKKYRKLKSDPRVTTRTARFIRKTGIDELPQLWNVFVGDMSLVGPRPILENEIGSFGTSLSECLLVRPGITGLWAVSGSKETTFERRIYWDSWYVRNWSIWGDIVIMFTTLKLVLAGN